MSSNSSLTSKPTKELLTPGEEHHGIGDGEWLVMTKNEDHPLWSPKRTPDLAPPMKNKRWRRLCLVDHDNSFSLIFSPNMWFYSIRVEVCGATMWEEPTWAREEGGVPWWVVPTQVPPPVVLGSRNSHILYKKSSWSFVPFRELLFLHKKQHHGSSAENNVSPG